MRTVAIALTIAGSVLAYPETGCFYLEINQEDSLKVKAQLEVKDTSSLAFSVLIRAPFIFPNDIRVVCENEIYAWDPLSSTITVGNEPLSPCLAELKVLTMGFVESPVVIKYNAAARQVTANIVVDLAMNKDNECLDFKTLPITYSKSETQPASQQSTAQQPATQQPTETQPTVVSSNSSDAPLLAGDLTKTNSASPLGILAALATIVAVSIL